jgi:hypothetical protein
MASIISFVPSTPPPEIISPPLPQHQINSTLSTARVVQQPKHVKRKPADESPTQLQTSRILSLSPLTATMSSMEITIRSQKEMQEIRQWRMNMLDGFGRKKRRFTEPKTMSPSEAKPSEFAHRARPSPPPAPRISRLPTPDLSGLEDEEFCACCDANESSREMGSDDRQRRGRTSTISNKESGKC